MQCVCGTSVWLLGALCPASVSIHSPTANTHKSCYHLCTTFTSVAYAYTNMQMLRAAAALPKCQTTCQLRLLERVSIRTTIHICCSPEHYAFGVHAQKYMQSAERRGHTRNTTANGVSGIACACPLQVNSFRILRSLHCEYRISIRPSNRRRRRRLWSALVSMTLTFVIHLCKQTSSLRKVMQSKETKESSSSCCNIVVHVIRTRMPPINILVNYAAG